MTSTGTLALGGDESASDTDEDEDSDSENNFNDEDEELAELLIRDEIANGIRFHES